MNRTLSSLLPYFSALVLSGALGSVGCSAPVDDASGDSTESSAGDVGALGAENLGEQSAALLNVDDWVANNMFAGGVPAGCVSGRDTAPLSMSLSVGCSGNDCQVDVNDTLKEWVKNLSFLEINSRKYKLKGQPYAVKAEGRALVDMGVKVFFFDSWQGYRGTSTTPSLPNTSADITKTLSIARPQPPVGQMWVMRWKAASTIDNRVKVDEVYCSYQDTYFQSAPSVAAVAVPGANISNLTVPVQYRVDDYSRVGVERVAAEARVYASTYVGGSAQTYAASGSATPGATQGKIDVSLSSIPADRGTVTFWGEVDDGTYVSDRVPVGSYTPECAPVGHSWTFQTSPGVGADPRAATGCGWNKYGRVCPVSARPETSGSYPVVRYTCQADPGAPDGGSSGGSGGSGSGGSGGSSNASCPTGHSWTYQTSSSSGGDPSAATKCPCGYDTVPVSSYSYPVLKYTCK